MATGSSEPGRKEDFRDTCSLCMEHFRGRDPKLLPCFHTFCTPCLTALQDSVALRPPHHSHTANSNESQQQAECNTTEAKGEAAVASSEGMPSTDACSCDGDVTQDENVDVSRDGSDDVTKVSSDDDTTASKKEKVTIVCPTCRAPVVLPEGGVASLQTNFYLDHEVSKEDTALSLCEMCPEEEQQPATHVCRQCPVYMCGTCRRYHDKLMPKHHVTPVSLGQPRQEERWRTEMCLVHRDQALCFHCRQCDVSLCIHCKMTSHDGHETVALTTAALQAKGEVTSLILEGHQQIQVMESSIRQVDHEDRQLSHHTQEMTQQIHARCDTLITWVKQSRDQLLEEVSMKEDTMRCQLRTEKTLTSVAIETLRALLSRAARASGSEADVMVVRKELKGALLSQDRLDQHSQRAHRQEEGWGWRYDVTASLQIDDIKSYMGQLTERESADIIKPMSLRELGGRTDEVMSQVTACKDDIKSLEADMANGKAEMTTMKKTEADLEKRTTTLHSDMATLKKKEEQLEKKTLEFQKKIEKARTMFYVRLLDNSSSKLKPNEPMVFKFVLHNRNNCYGVDTGTFTVQVTGVYFISATIESYSRTDTVRCTIMVGDKEHSVVEGGSGNVVLRLRAGEKVWLKAGSPAIGYCRVSRFLGVLLRAEM